LSGLPPRAPLACAPDLCLPQCPTESVAGLQWRGIRRSRTESSC
jgi:hypothetical protein